MPKSRSMSREFLSQMLFGDESERRFTQDSPIMPDVWYAYADSSQKGEPLDLLLTPHMDVSAGQLYGILEKSLLEACNDNESRPAEADYSLCYNQAVVAVKIGFRDMVRFLLPMTPWWHKYVADSIEEVLGSAKEKYRRMLSALIHKGKPPIRKEPLPPDEFVWLVKVVGLLLLDLKKEIKIPDKEDLAEVAKDFLEKKSKSIVKEFIAFAEELNSTGSESALTPSGLLWAINRNRTATLSIRRSARAVKADAARRLFNIDCSHLTWGVIDSGIDARHPAFAYHGKKVDFNPPYAEFSDKKRTRVVATYDFTMLRSLMDARTPDKLIISDSRWEKKQDEIEDKWTEIKKELKRAHDLDWDTIAPLIKMSYNNYRPPRIGHGTHVAGILAAGPPEKENKKANGNEEAKKEAQLGICPDFRLYDLRVFTDEGYGDEFTIMAAVQFVRHLNAHKDYTVVHGVNLSLSIAHDVANFACGRTPICEECMRLVDAGVVTVTAAGNYGYISPDKSLNGRGEYHSISITDPGNAERVLTVGATHRDLPHMYGVSYFSSRGPTGDGRAKPDLVAPGEKITAPVPGNDWRRMDGTSMAAPHVSGAAALLMARHAELVGDPMRVKEILCKTATDLGRERYFQGHGLVDALRAIQSV